MENKPRSTALALLFISAFALAIGLRAQTPGPPAPQTVNRTTVTGCVELTEQSVVGTSGSLGSRGAAVPDTTFILTRATATTPPVAAPPSAATPAGTATYRIDTADDGKLWLHVGHKVEITGTLDSTAAGALPKLQVQSVKLVSASCSE
jgi:hypothetical protein